MQPYRIIALAAVCFLAIAAFPVMAETGSAQGWYVIHSNIYDVKVYIDNKFMGTISEGTSGVRTLTIPTNSSGIPYKQIRVQKYGYSTYTSDLPEIPADGATVDVYATLTQLPDTSTTLSGTDVGWYVVHCNIDGATVLFDGSNRGTIANGVLYVPVYVASVPYKQFTVEKNGYINYTNSVPTSPGNGGTVDLYATLNPLPQQTANVSAQTIGGDTGWFIVHSNVDGASVSFDNVPQGTITNGTLRVQIYVTGTPFKTFTVYKSGYLPFTGTIDARPGKGESVDLNATLNAVAEPVTSTTQKSPLSFLGAAVSLAIMATLFSCRKIRE